MLFATTSPAYLMVTLFYFVSASLVQGCYPPELLKQWDIFHEKKKSENDRPGKNFIV
jgi:hypothetical protein